MQKHNFKSAKAFVDTFELPPYKKGKLDNLRFAVKDLIDIAGYVTGCGNPTWLKTHEKAVVNAVCVDQLLVEGATCIGKTITDELAFSLIGENFFYGTPLNPKAPDRVPGGSSSGSASAVACGLVDFALGTDTGGSVRVPASNSGIWGFRPSYGRISVAGVNPFAPTFDTVGVLAKDGNTLKEASCALLGNTKNIIPPESRQIYLLEDMLELCDEEVRVATNNSLKKIPIKKISLTKIMKKTINSEWLLNTYGYLQWAEIWSTLGTWIVQNSPEFGPATKKNFELTKNLDRTIIQQYISQREFFAKQINDFLGKKQLLCFPTTPTLAPKIGTVGTDRSKDNYYQRTLAFTAIAGLARAPQVTLPLDEINKIPHGISFLGAYGNDEFLLAAAVRLKN